MSIAGVSVTELAAEYGTPLFVIDEDDFRGRCREIAAAFGGGRNVHYAAKAFLCSEIARWVDEEGLSSTWPAAASWRSHCMPAFRPSESRSTATTNRSTADRRGQGRGWPRRARLDDRDRTARHHRR